MSTKNKSAGTCLHCEASFAKAPMVRHLERCAYPHAKDVVEVARLRIDMPDSPFWLDVDVKVTSTLRQLDEFLRETWLDCCGHLSAFTIADQRYVVSMDDDSEPDAKTMKTKMATALPPPGTVFGYEYDYGSTTALRLEVIELRHAPARREAVRLLARNDAPARKCSKCSKPATHVCSSCYMEDPDTFFCDAHMNRHRCEEANSLPVINSPRMGVCGYVG